MESVAVIDPPAEVPSKGVRKRGDKWVAEIRNRRLKRGRHPGRKWLGTFSSAAEAREAYLLAVRKIKQPLKTSKSARARSPEVDEPSNSQSSSSALFNLRGGRRRGEAEDDDQQPASRRPMPMRFLSNTVKKEPAVAGPADSTGWSSDEETDLPPSPESKGIRRKVSNQSLNVPKKATGSHPAVKVKSEAVTSEDDLHASREVQQASCSTPFADALNYSYSEFCTSASPSSSSTSSLFDEEIENQRPDEFVRRKSGDFRHKDDSVKEVDNGDPEPETAQVLTNVTNRVEPVPRSAEMVGGSSLFTCISGVILDDYVKFAAVHPEGTHCALVDEASDVSNLCPCSLKFIDNQKHCPTSVCLWKHITSCPLAGGNPEGNMRCFSSNQRQGHRYLLPDHFDDLRIRTKNFSAFKTKQLIFELEAELFVDARYSTVPRPQVPPESSGIPQPAIPIRKGK
ncbi:hypothetical protein R1sor_005953 [Riccia sorocarpa]|uniref:AP2/ERF domain-containing protein n=1 Tax=Riccia sorocarpa TaxID=122646 RepID=A0ABD3HNZ4_9MARC